MTTDRILILACVVAVVAPALCLLYTRSWVTCRRTSLAFGLTGAFVAGFCVSVRVVAPRKVDSFGLGFDFAFESGDLAVFGATTGANLAAVVVLGLGWLGQPPRALTSLRLATLWLFVGLAVVLGLLRLGLPMASALFPGTALVLASAYCLGTRQRSL